MNFRIALESYLELDSEDEYTVPCKKARLVRGLEKCDEPVYEVEIRTLEEFMAIVSEVGCPVEVEGRTITIRDRNY